MRLTTVILLIGCLQATASSIGQVVTLKERSASIGKIFRLIKDQTGYEFLYNTLSVEKAKPVTIDVENAALEKVLELCFENQPFRYRIINKTIIVSVEGSFSNEMNKEKVSIPPSEVKGRVVDEDGQPLEGVSIMLKGSKGGGVTKADGSFVITVPDTKVILVFSFVGYVRQEFSVKGTSPVLLTMVKESAGLTDVVVVGYGKSSRQNLASAVSSVKGDDLNRGAITDVGQLLQGKVPGLNISASGDPNRPAAIVLRGASTINSSQSPFYVIDGIPGADISTIAPDDIASIDVLKDAAATAIYGNRAANGVIMITSKKGKKNQSRLTYSGYVATEQVSNQIDMMDSTQLRTFIAKNGLSFLPANDKGANTDWQSEIQRKSAFSHNHNISFSGGGDHSSVSASINYAKKEGIIIGSDLTRIIGRINYDQFLLNDKVKIGVSLTNSNNDANNVPNRNFALLQSVSYLPVSPVRNPDGTYFENLNTPVYFNPVAIINEAQDNTKSNNLIGSLSAQVKLPFGLTYDMVVSYQNYSSQHGEYYNRYYTKYNAGNFYNNPEPPVQHTLIKFGNNGSAFRSSYENNSKILETFVTWDRKFGAHSINAVLGYSWQNNISGDGFQTSSSNFTVDNLGYNNLALSNPYADPSYRINFGQGTDYQEIRLISYFGRANYSFKDRYILQASIRRDGSSVFGTNNSWGYFPAAGAAWRISKEDFMADQNIFNDLKLRISYGVTGNATGFNAYTAKFISGILGSNEIGGSVVNAYGPVQAANPDLKWEKTATTNMGVDFTILDGMVNATIDVYDKKTTGMIYNYKVNPILVPTASITANGGSMSNRGIEIGINATPFKNRSFSWATSLNLAHNKNEITSLRNPRFSGGDSITITSPGGEGQTGGTLQILKEGKPVGQFYTYEYVDSKDAQGNSQFVARAGGVTSSPVTSTDYRYMGSPQPKLLLGFANSWRYSKFDLNIFLRGVFGNKIFNATRADLYRPSKATSYNLPVEAANESSKDGKAHLYSSRFIENGSYLRFDNATLGYNFNLNSSTVKALRLYASVNNLFVITGYKGIDPEVNQGGIAPGVDTNNFYPKTRTVLVGVNVSL